MQTPVILATFTDANGEPFGPSLPIIGSGPSDLWHGEDSLQAVEEWANSHAHEIMGNRESATVTISDSVGTSALLTVTGRVWNPGTEWERIGHSVDRCASLPSGVFECEHCSRLTTDGECTTVSGETACSHCHDAGFTCDECGERFTQYEANHTHEDDTICDGCCRASYSYCAWFDCYYPDADMVAIFGGGIYIRHSRRNQISREAAELLCERGELWVDSDGDYTADYTESADYEPEPDDDEPEHQGEHGGMRRFGYHTEANDALGRCIPAVRATYGAELEYKGEPDDWEAVAEACKGKAILTDDSTVSGELVSAAMGAGEMRRYLQDVSAALAGSRNDSATGLHFHVGRQALTAWQWFRLQQYTKQHADLLNEIAGRDSERWGSFRKVSANNWRSFVNVWHDSCGDRYDGWGFRPNTVELRVCRATKTPRRILARFGMLQRLIAIGRLPDSAKPSAPDLKGWLAQDANIRAITRWEPNDWNYREALQLPAQGPDLSPGQAATRADLWLAEVRYQAAKRHAHRLYHMLRMPWEGREDTTDRINRILYNEEQEREQNARRTLRLLTT